MRIKDLNLRVLSNEQINNFFYQIDFEASEMAPPNPGQFVNIAVGKENGILLRRPLSIFNFEDERLSLLYRVIGKGTEILSTKKRGDTMHVLGPLGKGFPICHGPALLVAGGAGVPPIWFLGKLLQQKEISACLGFRNHNEVLQRGNGLLKSKIGL